MLHQLSCILFLLESGFGDWTFGAPGPSMSIPCNFPLPLFCWRLPGKLVVVLFKGGKIHGWSSWEFWVSRDFRAGVDLSFYWRNLLNGGLIWAVLRVKTSILPLGLSYALKTSETLQTLERGYGEPKENCGPEI